MQWGEQQKGVLSEGLLLNSRSHRRNKCLSQKRDIMLKQRSYCTRADYTGAARSTGRVKTWKKRGA